jgi:hypothetical protein
MEDGAPAIAFETAPRNSATKQNRQAKLNPVSVNLTMNGTAPA